MTRAERLRPTLLVGSVVVVLALLCLLSVGLGALTIPPVQVVQTVFGHPRTEPSTT